MSNRIDYSKIIVILALSVLIAIIAGLWQRAYLLIGTEFDRGNLPHIHQENCLNLPSAADKVGQRNRNKLEEISFYDKLNNSGEIHDKPPRGKDESGGENAALSPPTEESNHDPEIEKLLEKRTSSAIKPANRPKKSIFSIH